MGYIGNKGSERMQEARDKGMRPYSQLSAFEKYVARNSDNVNEEGHHTGKFYNETNVYGFDDIDDDEGEQHKKDYEVFKKERREERKKEREEQAKMPKEPKTYGIRELYKSIWGGTRKFPKIVGKEKKIVYSKENKYYDANSHQNIRSSNYDESGDPIGNITFDNDGKKILKKELSNKNYKLYKGDIIEKDGGKKIMLNNKENRNRIRSNGKKLESDEFKQEHEKKYNEAENERKNYFLKYNGQNLDEIKNKGNYYMKEDEKNRALKEIEEKQEGFKDPTHEQNYAISYPKSIDELKKTKKTDDPLENGTETKLFKIEPEHLEKVKEVIKSFPIENDAIDVENGGNYVKKLFNNRDLGHYIHFHKKIK